VFLVPFCPTIHELGLTKEFKSAPTIRHVSRCTLFELTIQSVIDKVFQGECLIRGGMHRRTPQEATKMGKKKWYEKNLGDNLPIEYKKRGHPVSGCILILIGTFFGILMGWSLIEEMLDKGFEPTQLGMLVFILPGLAAFITGLFLFYKIELTIDAASVTYKKRRLFFKNIAWSEALSQYDGILMEETDHSPRYGAERSGQSYTTYELTLRHVNNKKHYVVLYTSRKQKGFREQSEKFAVMLNKPILQHVGNGEFNVREVDQLDKKAIDLVREGKIKVYYDKSQFFKFKNIDVQRMGDTVSISMFVRGGRAVPYAFFLGAALVGCLPIIIKHEAVREIIPFNLFAAFFGLLGVIVFLITKEKSVLTVAPDKISIHHEIMGKKFFGQSILASQIEEVSVYKRKNEELKQLQIAGDHGCIRVGQILTDEERKWVKSCILSTIRS